MRIFSFIISLVDKRIRNNGNTYVKDVVIIGREAKNNYTLLIPVGANIDDYIQKETIEKEN